MKKNILSSVVFALAMFSMFYFVSGCDDSGIQNEGDYVTGYVTFTDTNLIQGGNYGISMYRNKSNPFDTMPIRSEAITMTKTNNQYKCYFKFSGVESGSYYFAVTFNRTPAIPNRLIPVLGTRGCDTNRNCTSHKLVTFPNHSYEDCNIISWTDTLKRLN